jgi:phage terminase large subunit
VTNTLTKSKQRIVRINKVYTQLFGITCRYMVVYGGRRSSKSWSVSQLLQKKAVENPGRKIIVMRKVAATIKLSTWERVKSAISETMPLSLCDINKSEKSIVLPNGSSYHFVGADDPEKLKSLEGATDYWLEETNEFDEIDLDTIDAGLSPNLAEGEPPAQIFMTFNPVPQVEGFQHWLQTRYIMKIKHVMSIPQVENDVCILQTWYRDNAFCPDATIKMLEQLKYTNPSLYKMWALGLYVALEGVIFAPYDKINAPTGWDIVDEVYEGANFLGYGLDFGFADDPVAIVAVWSTHTDMWFKEVAYATGLTNPNISAVMVEAGIRKHLDQIIADNAEPKSIAELQEMGWIVAKCFKAPDYKRAAIQNLQGYRKHITRDSVNIIREISTWCWRKDKASGKSLPIPCDGNDHMMDAMIYRTFTNKEWGVVR